MEDLPVVRRETLISQRVQERARRSLKKYGVRASDARPYSFRGTAQDWVRRRDAEICTYCGAPGKHCDHVVPVSLRGPTVTSNLVYACISCNLRKRGSLPPAMIVTALKHLLSKGENIDWIYDYGKRVQELRQDVSSAEALAGFLLGCLPERVVGDRQPSNPRTGEKRTPNKVRIVVTDGRPQAQADRGWMDRPARGADPTGGLR